MENNEWNVLDCIIKTHGIEKGADAIEYIKLIKEGMVYKLNNMEVCKRILTNSFAANEYGMWDNLTLAFATVVGNKFEIQYREEGCPTDSDVRFVHRVFVNTYQLVTTANQTKELLGEGRDYEISSSHTSYAKATPVKKGGFWPTTEERAKLGIRCGSAFRKDDTK